VRLTGGTLAMALVALCLVAARAEGAGWVGPVALPGAPSTVPQTAAVARTGWLGVALQGGAAGTEQVLLRDPAANWAPSTVSGVGTVNETTLALNERGDAVLAVANSAGQVLAFGHAAGGSGFAPIGTVLPSGYASSTLAAVALENGTVAVVAGTATDLVLATGAIGGPVIAGSVRPAGTTAPKSPKLVANPRGDALLVFADHTAAPAAERLDGLRRAPGGAFVPFGSPLDSVATQTTGNVITPMLDDAGATELVWIADTGPSTSEHVRAGHLPAGTSALSTPAANRSLRVTGANEQVQGPIAAVPLAGDDGAGLYVFVNLIGPVITPYGFAHSGAAGAYTQASAPTVPTGAFFAIPDPEAGGRLALIALTAGSHIVAVERQADGTYAAAAPGPMFPSLLGSGHNDGADSIFPASVSGVGNVLLFDATSPVLGAPTVPATIVAGAPAALSVAAGDVSGLPTLAWSFGDGGTGAGASVSHTWAAPGTYTIGVTATDTVGHQSTQTRQVVVVPRPPAPDTTRPVLTKVKLSPSSVPRRKPRTATDAAGNKSATTSLKLRVRR
jgi:PKD domain